VPSIADRRAQAAIGVLALIAWLELSVRVVWPAVGGPHWPSPGYWVAGRLVLEGRIDLLWAEAPVFAAEAMRLGTVPDIFNTNAPPSVLPFLPLAVLDETTAHALWLLIGLTAFAAAWRWLLRELAVPPLTALAATALVPLFGPFRENLARGQAYLVLLALVIAAAMLARRDDRRRYLAVAALAGAGVLKLYYGLVVGLAWAIGRATRRVALGAGLAVAAVALGTVVAWGIDPWIAAARAAAGWRTRPESTVTAYQTVNGLLGQLFRPDPAWNPTVVADAPWLATVAWLAIAAVVGAVTLLAVRALGDGRALAGTETRGRAAAARVVPTALAVLVALLLAPVAEDHHFTLALLPLVVTATLLEDGGDRPAWVVRVAFGALAAGAVLLGAPWPYEVPDAHGWAALLHYPRLYGTLAVWLALVAICFARGRETAASARRDDGRSKGAWFGPAGEPV
jgi:hypothetical protein